MKRLLLGSLRVAVTLLLVAWVFSRISLREVLDQVSEASLPPLAGALGLFVLSILAGAWQWGRYLAAQGVDLPGRRILELYWIGLFFNNFLPGNLGGDLVKVWDLRREQRDTLAAATATLADRITGLSALAFLALVASLFLLGQPELAELARGVAIGAGAFLLGALLFLLDPMATWLRRVGQRLGLFAEDGLRGRMLDQLRRLRLNRGLLLRLFVFSLAVQALRVGVHYLVCRALVGPATPAYPDFFLAVPPLAFALVLPVTVGGLGLREGLAIPLFRPLGLTGKVPVALQLLAYLLMLLASSLGGLLFLLRLRGRRSA